MDKKKIIAYFSMEFGFFNEMPSYAGGLAFFAADFLFSCADQGINAAGVSLVYHQEDDPQKAFDPGRFMKKLDKTIELEIEDRKVKAAVWQMDIAGKNGHIVPVFFLSTYLPENAPWDRDLTRHLYAGDRYTRLGQEVILGIGGVRLLEALGCDVSYYHMNEGHAAFGIFELLRKFKGDTEKVRSVCTATVHTPLPAGRENFDYGLVFKTLGGMVPQNVKDFATAENMSMTRFMMNLSRKTNSVSEKHWLVCGKIYQGFNFENVTNGIYHPRWAGKYMKILFGKHLKGWENNPEIFKKAVDIPDNDIAEARFAEKKDLIGWLNSRRDTDYFKESVLTIGFARRFVPYKRPALIFRDLEQLKKIGASKLQLVFAYRCHPDDSFCNETKNFIERCADELRGEIKIALIPDYDFDVAKRLVAGCDIWLNNPIPENEASGTSGMKAALNGVLHLSSLDGWWDEGYKMDSAAGWGLDGDCGSLPEKRDESDAKELYRNLKDAADCYYGRKHEWTEKSKHAIGLISFFNTHRVAKEYKKKMWPGLQ